jgi:hypothetical protein
MSARTQAVEERASLAMAAIDDPTPPAPITQDVHGSKTPVAH